MSKIIDLEGLSFSDLRQIGFFSVAQAYMNMYPDIIHRMIIVNAPTSFFFFYEGVFAILVSKNQR